MQPARRWKNMRLYFVFIMDVGLYISFVWGWFSVLVELMVVIEHRCFDSQGICIVENIDDIQ